MARAAKESMLLGGRRLDRRGFMTRGAKETLLGWWRRGLIVDWVGIVTGEETLLAWWLTHNGLW